MVDRTVGPAADLYEQLQELGLEEPRDGVPLLRVLCLTHEPAAGGGVQVPRIDTFEQFVAAQGAGMGRVRHVGREAREDARAIA